MTVDIRPMLKNDEEAVMRILRNTPEFKPFEVVVAGELIDDYLEDPASDYYHLVAESGSEVLGYICYGPTPLTEGTWDVYWMAVDHDRQGQGIGGRLLETAEAKMSVAKARIIIIETSTIPSYEKTQRFYLSHNYEIIATIPDFYAPGDGKLILQKRFQPA